MKDLKRSSPLKSKDFQYDGLWWLESKDLRVKITIKQSHIIRHHRYANLNRKLNADMSVWAEIYGLVEPNLLSVYVTTHSSLGYGYYIFEMDKISIRPYPQIKQWQKRHILRYRKLRNLWLSKKGKYPRWNMAKCRFVAE